MNNLQLKTRISQICGISGSSADGAEEWQLVQDVLNEAVIDVLSRTRINVRGLTINLIAGEQEYDLGSSVLQVFDLYRGTTELQEVSTGDFPEAGSYGFAVFGFNRIAFGFVPSAGDTVKGYYTPLPLALTADTDDPSTTAYGSIPVQFHATALVNYCCSKLADMTGDQGSQRGEKYRIAYEGQNGLGGIGSDLGNIKTLINKRGGSGSSRSRLRRAGERSTSDSDPMFWQG